jgi:hypothetical protein
MPPEIRLPVTEKDVTQLAIRYELCLALEKLGASRELLTIVGRWGDTYDDDQTLRAMQAHNRAPSAKP